MKLRVGFVVAAWIALAATTAPIGTDAVVLTAALTVASAVTTAIGLRSRSVSDFTMSVGILAVSYGRSMLMTDGADELAPLTGLTLVVFVVAASAFLDGRPEIDQGWARARTLSRFSWVAASVALLALLGSVDTLESDSPTLTWGLGLAAAIALVLAIEKGNRATGSA